MPDLERMQQLLRDRQTPKGKGRASAPMPIMMEADLAIDLEQAKNLLNVATNAVADEEKKAAGDQRQGGGTPPDLAAAQKELAAAQKAVDEAQEAADEVTVQIVFTALTDDDFDQLLMQHPPRDDDEGDQTRGYNRATFGRALLAASPAKVLTLDGDPFDLDPAETLAGMSHGEKDLARSVVLGLNVQTFSVPFSAANSRSRPRSGGKSKRR